MFSIVREPVRWFMPGAQRLNPMQMTMSGVLGKRARLLKGRLASETEL